MAFVEMKSDDTFENRQRAIANEEYEESVRSGHKIPIRTIERRNGLKKNALVYYRANFISRKKLLQSELV